MGTGSSFLHNNDEDDVLGAEYGSSNGVIKRIPIEVQPRGKLGLRSVSSFGKKQKGGGSLRSALSVDLDNPEVERIRKEFEMFKRNKENEIANIQKKEQKLETENRRLRTELKALQKTCRRFRDERDSAIEAEHQALVRAATFENDRDKIQRQFKIFRETKENEIQTLLRARRELENKVAKLSHGVFDDVESVSRGGMEGALGTGNTGDWWAGLESEPSLGSTTQLHTTGFKGPEFAHSVMELEGPFTNVNKDDWNTAAASLAHVIPTIPDTLQTNTMSLYVCAASDMLPHLNHFIKDHCPALSAMCSAEGRFLNVVHMPLGKQTQHNTTLQSRSKVSSKRRIEACTVFIAFVSSAADQHLYEEVRWSCERHSVIYCTDTTTSKKKSSEADELMKDVRTWNKVKVISGSNMTLNQGTQQAAAEVEKILLSELGVDSRRDKEGVDLLLESEGPEMLCGGSLWDSRLDHEQNHSLAHAARSTCELSFEKLYERLHAHVSAAGPLPPLLITGTPGSGKSLLLAKWIELQQHKLSGSLVLYHFVGSQTSCSADPVLMIRRLTAQILQHVSVLPTLTCDPARLVEEFPRWLERVSSKLPGGIILVLDSIDRFQQGESQLKWLLDPLPVDSRVIVSVHEEICPQSWRSWPTVQIESLSNKNVRELLRAEMASMSASLTPDQESGILTHCRSPSTCVPLYVVVLASHLARYESEETIDKKLESLLRTSDCVELYSAILEEITADYEAKKSHGVLKQVLQQVYASRNGVSESELFCLLPELSWSVWAPLCDALLDRHIIVIRSGLMVFRHQQAEDAVGVKYFSGSEALNSTRRALVQYYSQFQTPNEVTYRVADELPWLVHQLGDKEALHNSLANLCIFVKLYARGRCEELISYWQYVGVEKGTMAKMYLTSLKQMEQMVGAFDGMVTLPRIADVYEALGRFLRDLGLLAEALTPLQRALEIRELALDPDHPSVAQTLHQVAGLHAQQAKFQTAEALYKQALEIYEGAFGKEHYLVGKELDALAMLYQRQGKHELAEPLHKRAVFIQRRSRAPRVQSGQMRSVDPLKRRVLQLEELAMGPDSADLARTLNELGVLYYLQNNVETGESFFRRSLEMRESVLDSDHPDIAQSLNNLAALYNDRKQYDKAELLYERALHIRLKHCTPDHQSVASVINHLAMLYKKMGKLKKAEPLYRQAVDIRERSFGSNHPSVATALVNLAVLYSQQGNHSAAEPLYERALKIYEEGLGPNHPRVSETLKNIALLKYDQGDYENAARLYKRAMEIKEADAAYSAKPVASRRSSSADTLSIAKHATPSHANIYYTNHE